MPDLTTPMALHLAANAKHTIMPGLEAIIASEFELVAVEHQAVTAALDALAAKVEGLYGQFHPMCAIEDEPTDHQVVSRKAVLAAITEAKAYREDTDATD